MKIAVLGSGNSGQALAGTLTLSGHEVHLAAVPEHATQIRILQSLGGVWVEADDSLGVMSGFAKIARIDTEVGEAVSESELIILALPAYAQDAYFETLAEYAQPNAVVLIQPGKFGALRFAQTLRKHQRDPSELLIAETSTSPYAAKISGLGCIWIRGVKKETLMASWPAQRFDELRERTHPVFPSYVRAKNVLMTSISDGASVLHPVTTLMNLSRLETMGPYRTHGYDLTPQVGRMVEAVDQERCRVAAAFDVPFTILQDQLKNFYGLEGETVYEVVSHSHVHRDQITPRNADHRYITEDVPYGLVPILRLARMSGFEVPATQAIVTMASIVNETDYEGDRYSSEALGLNLIFHDDGSLGL